MPHGVKFWTDEKARKLLSLIEEGYSFSYAGSFLGCTRNAAIGKYGRLKGTINSRGYATKSSKDRQRQLQQRRVNQQRKRAIKSGKLIPPPVMLQPLPPMDVPLSSSAEAILNLGPKQCKWPTGDPKGNDFGFCKEDRAKGRPYCEAHWESSYRLIPRPTRNPSLMEQSKIGAWK